MPTCTVGFSSRFSYHWLGSVELILICRCSLFCKMLANQSALVFLALLPVSVHG